MGKFSDVEQIIRNPAHNMSGFGIIEESERLLLDVIEELLAHVCFDVYSKFMAKVTDDKLKKRTKYVDEK